jgi:hypothetical protein
MRKRDGRTEIKTERDRDRKEEKNGVSLSSHQENLQSIPQMDLGSPFRPHQISEKGPRSSSSPQQGTALLSLRLSALVQLREQGQEQGGIQKKALFLDLFLQLLHLLLVLLLV